MTMPGMIPAMNRAPTEAPETVAYTTRGMEGGMIGPNVEEAAVTQQEKSLSNPFSFMALISMEPSPPASDTAVPDIPAKLQNKGHLHDPVRRVANRQLSYRMKTAS